MGRVFMAGAFDESGECGVSRFGTVIIFMLVFSELEVFAGDPHAITRPPERPPLFCGGGKLRR
jgi:hypothetical protein